MALRINLLGGLQVLSGAADARPRGRKARGLLAYIAVAPDQRVSRERAADLLWSDRGAEQARGSLRQTLAELRSGDPALRDAVAISRDAVALAPGRAEIDIDLIHAAVQRADIGALARLLDAADTFLVDLSNLSPVFDDWLRVERTRQVDAILAAVAAVVPTMIGVAPAMDMQAILRSLDRLDPWNETIARLGLEADHAAGDIASLHKRFRRLVDGLRREFDVAPSRETQALFDRLAGEPAPHRSTRPERALPDTAPPMMLVSPIQLVGADPAAAELAAILTDDIRTALMHHADLRILALTDADLERVERLCQGSVAAYMLSGRIRTIGDDIRVNLQIGDVASSAVIWSEQLKVDSANLVAAVDDVVERAVGAVLPAIDRDLSTRVRLSDFSNGDVATLYAKARRLIGRGLDLGETRAGVDLLEQVVAAEPQHIGARLLLARMYNNDLWQRVAGHDFGAFRARAMALTEEVAALAPTDGRIQLRLAWCHLRRRDWARAERGLNAALTRLAYDADALNECAAGFSLLGELDRAEPLIQRAFRLNPFAPSDYHADRGIFLMLRGDAAAAEEHFDVSGEHGPLYLGARLINMTRLSHPERGRLRDDFSAAFHKAWSGDRPAALADVLDWIDYTYPLRQPVHVALFKDGLRAALEPDWRAAAQNGR